MILLSQLFNKRKKKVLVVYLYGLEQYSRHELAFEVECHIFIDCISDQRENLQILLHNNVVHLQFPSIIFQYLGVFKQVVKTCKGKS